MPADDQVPRAGQVFLDHVGWFVSDIATAGHAFERLGFALTPYTEHRNTNPDGASVPAGTANRCAMLARGYLEIMTATATGDTPIARQVRHGLMRYQGVHVIAFSCADGETERARLAGAGFDPQPVVDLTRPVALHGGRTGTAAFSVVRVPPESMPEGRIQFLVQKTPELVWRTELIARDNAIEALTGVLVVVADLVEAATRYARFTGRAFLHVRDGAAILLDRGRIAFAGAESAKITAHDSRPAPPFIAAVALRSHDLAATRTYLNRMGIRLAVDAADHVIVAPPDAAGAELVIHARGADERLYAR